MFVTIEDTEPRLPFLPPPKGFLFYNDQRTGGMRSVDRHGDITATVVAALNEASGAPPLTADPTRILVDTGSQTTCMRKIASFGVTKKTPPTGDFGIPFALLDGGNSRHTVKHGGPLYIVTVGGAIPIKISKAVHARNFGFDILSVGVMEKFGATIVLGPSACLEKGKTSIALSGHCGLFLLGVSTATYLSGAGAALTATRQRLQMPELEATATPIHDASTAPLHDNTISKSKARLRRPTLTNHVHNPGAAPWTPTAQYAEIFAGVSSMSSAAKAHGGEIAMLIEKEPVARESMRRCFRTRRSKATSTTTRSGSSSSAS